LENKHKYPIGASRICACYGDYISDAEGTDKVVFLVQEMCGRNLKNMFIDENKKSRTVNVDAARTLTKQMIQGLAFLQMFDPPLIHHDLKPANVCVNDKGQVKIIDWGALVHGTISDMFKGTAATPLYMPPETKSRIKSFEQPWWSYDVYALGLMHMEMVCPMVAASDWYYESYRSENLYKRVVRAACPTYKLSETDLERDVGIIAALANHDPKSRPEPMKFLYHPSLADVPTPQVQEEEAEQLLIFKVGDEVEYWSTTYGEWKAAVVGNVRVANGLYDLLHPSSAGKQNLISTDWMRRGADPARVRTPEKNLRASVSDEFIVRPSRLDEIGDLGSSGLLHLRPQAKPVTPIRTPLSPIDEPLSPIKKPVVKPMINQELQFCSTISLSDPKVWTYRREGLLVDSFLTCPLVSHTDCTFESATVYCGFGTGQRRYPAVFKDLGSLMKASSTIPHSAEILGTRCTMNAIGTVTTRVGHTKTTERCKSLTKFFALKGSE